MSNDAKKTSELTVANTLSSNDRVVILKNPDSSAATQTITANSFFKYSTNIFPKANTTQLGIVKVDGTTIVAQTNGIISANTLAFNSVGASYARIIGDPNTGINALYTGVADGYSTVSNPVIQASVNKNDYAQINFQNINPGNKVSSDIVATASNGDDYHQYIDLGITGGGWDGTQDNSLTDALGEGDGYLYVQGGYGGGHLVVGTTTANQWTKVISGGANQQFITAEFFPPNTQSYNTGLGSLVVHGGIGANGFVCSTDVKVSNTVTFSDSTTQNTAFQKVTVPTHSTSNGVVGQIAWDSGYIYICVSTNTWKRVALNLTSW
jgi:hypothetical protein